jgi:hypothetical protein
MTNQRGLVYAYTLPGQPLLRPAPGGLRPGTSGSSRHWSRSCSRCCPAGHPRSPAIRAAAQPAPACAPARCGPAGPVRVLEVKDDGPPPLMFVRPTSHSRAFPLIRAHRGLEEVRSGESRCIAQSCRIDKVGACLEIPGGTAHRCSPTARSVLGTGFYSPQPMRENSRSRPQPLSLSRRAVGRPASGAPSHGDACHTRNHPRDNSVHGPDSRSTIAEAEDVRLHQLAAREWSGACEAPLTAHWHTP